VIDFGDATLGDPALDFAGILNDHSRRFLDRVLTHYAGEVTPLTMRRTEFFIAVAPLYAVRAAARLGDAGRLAASLRTLRTRVRGAVVRGRVGP
jgi:aminoglycoside 2''-phosphotransferase